jgi:hypothetical protein
MGESDNITFEMSFDSKTKALMEKYTKTTEQLTKIMQATGKTDATMELKAAELKHKTEMMKTANVQEENKAAESDRRNTHQLIEQGRLNRLDIKYKKEFLLQETRQKNKMLLAEKRHFNEMMERMVSGGTATKLIGMGIMGAGAAKKGGGMLSGVIGQQAKKSAMWRGLKLETGEMSQAENEERAGGISIGFGDNKAKEVTRKTQGFLRDNKMGQGIVKAMEKSKIFNEKAGAALGKAKGGLGIAGIGALGIGGSIITKAIESSPIAQSMMKIMSTAFTLILRPIGDFFGGVMKPIALRLLKFGAENVGQGATLFKMGEKVGIAALAMFTNPADFFGALADRAFGTLAIALDPLKSEAQKATAYASMLLGFDTKMEEIAGVAAGDMASLVTQASQQVISGLGDTQKIITTGFGDLIEKVDEAEKKIYTNQEYADIYAESGKQGQQWVHENMDKESWWWKNIGSKTGQVDPIGGATDEPKIGEGAYVGAAQTVKELEAPAREILAHFEAYKEGLYDMTALNDAQLENYQTYINTVTDEMATHQEIMDAGKAYAQAQSETVYNQNDYNSLTDGQNTTLRTITDELGLINGEFERIRAEVEKIKIRAPRGMSTGGGHQRKATGGMITEPVIGIGQHTGETWSFGERGMEYVTPNTSFGGTNNYDQKNNVVINVTIEKVTGNTDLQQIKPIVERALRESHSRRGII